MFESLDDQLEYLEERDMDIARAALLVAHGRPREAAELHLSEGRTLEAINFFIQDTESEDSSHRAIECILDGLWRKLSFSVPLDFLAEDSGLYELFELEKKVNQASLIPNYRNEVSLAAKSLKCTHFDSILVSDVSSDLD